MRNGLLEMTIGFLRLGGPFKAGRTVRKNKTCHNVGWKKNSNGQSLRYKPAAMSLEDILLQMNLMNL